jgi:hypothetical protein
MTTTVNEISSSALNEQQILMLRLLKKPLPEADFIQVRKLAVTLLAKQLDETVDKWEIENDMTEDGYDELSKMHFRSTSKHNA